MPTERTCSNEGLYNIRALRDLNLLSVRETAVGDAGIAPHSHSPRLSNLNLGRTKFRPGAFRAAPARTTKVAVPFRDASRMQVYPRWREFRPSSISTSMVRAKVTDASLTTLASVPPPSIRETADQHKRRANSGSPQSHRP